jgi:hypothetical protein
LVQRLEGDEPHVLRVPASGNERCFGFVRRIGTPLVDAILDNASVCRYRDCCQSQFKLSKNVPARCGLCGMAPKRSQRRRPAAFPSDASSSAGPPAALQEAHGTGTTDDPSLQPQFRLPRHQLWWACPRRGATVPQRLGVRQQVIAPPSFGHDTSRKP